MGAAGSKKAMDELLGEVAACGAVPPMGWCGLPQVSMEPRTPGAQVAPGAPRDTQGHQDLHGVHRMQGGGPGVWLFRNLGDRCTACIQEGPAKRPVKNAGFLIKGWASSACLWCLHPRSLSASAALCSMDSHHFCWWKHPGDQAGPLSPEQRAGSLPFSHAGITQSPWELIVPRKGTGSQGEPQQQALVQSSAFWTFWHRNHLGVLWQELCCTRDACGKDHWKQGAEKRSSFPMLGALFPTTTNLCSEGFTSRTAHF